MPSVERLVPTLQQLFTTVAEEAAQSTGCIQRPTGKFTGASLCQTLVFGVLEQPLPHLRSWCQAAAGLGLAVTPQAIDQRLNARTAAMLEQVLARAIQQVVTAEGEALPVLQRFQGVYLQDCTQIAVPPALAGSWPGCGNQSGPTASVKLGVRLEVTHGSLQGPTLVPGRIHDREAVTALPPLPPASLRIADLGFFSLVELAAHGASGAYYLTRIQAGTTVFTSDGRKQTLLSLLRKQTETVVDLEVELGVSQRLPCRLLAIRVPAAVVAHRRQRLQDEGERRGQPVPPERLALAAWTILATNVPRELLTVPEALVLARLRWQIELLFKGWKSGSRQIATWRTEQVDKLRCEFFAKLLAAVVEHWLLVTTCWDLPDRSLEQARQAIRAFAAALLGALTSTRHLRQVLAALTRRCRTACRIAPRSRHPAAFQLLRQPDLLAGWLMP